MERPTPGQFGLTDSDIQRLRSLPESSVNSHGCLDTLISLALGAGTLAMVVGVFAGSLYVTVFVVGPIATRSLPRWLPAFVLEAGGFLTFVVLAWLPFGVFEWVSSRASRQVEKHQQPKPEWMRFQEYERAFHSWRAWKEREAKRQLDEARQASIRFWRQLDGAGFEREVASLLRRLGHRVRRVGGAGDGGVDLWVDKGWLIQCKAHARPLGPGVIRDLLGAKVDKGAERATLVTLVGVSRAAGILARRHEIEVWGADALINLSEEARHQNGTPGAQVNGGEASEPRRLQHLQEAKNAIARANKDISMRSSLVACMSEIRLVRQDIVLFSSSDLALNEAREVLEKAFLAYNVPLEALSYGPVEPARDGSVRQKVTLEKPSWDRDRSRE